MGLVYEPLSAIRKEVLRNGATWALYGFESVIWARRDLARSMHEESTSLQR